MKLRRRPQNAIQKPMSRWGWFFLLPMVAAFAIGFVWPFIQGIYLSFCQFRLISDAEWIGIDNYIKVFQDANFMRSFGYSAVFAIVSLIIINVLAFLVAYVLTQGIKGANLFRTVFFMPNLEVYTSEIKEFKKIATSTLCSAINKTTVNRSGKYKVLCIFLFCIKISSLLKFKTEFHSIITQKNNSVKKL